MKWSKKAHEFEQFEAVLMQKRIYIFGAGEYGAYLYKNIASEKVVGFIDNSVQKQKQGYLGQKVFSLDEISKPGSETLIVIAVSGTSFGDIKGQLISHGVEMANIVSYELYMHLYFYYTRNSLLIHQVSVSITQKCTLNCKDCSIMTTYLSEKKNYTLETLKKDVDLFFSHVDYLGIFGIVGGEPFLYPELGEYLIYLSQYQDRILRKIQIVTNGTIIPSDDLLELCRQYGIEISISDYSRTLPHLENRINKLIENLKQHQILYLVNKADYWIDFGYNYVNNTETDEAMIRFFDQCHMTCRLLKDGKLYYCANSTFAIDAGLNYNDKENELELSQINEENKMEAVEFDEGYSCRGYLNMCRHCNGFLGLNQHYIKVAEQA